MLEMTVFRQQVKNAHCSLLEASELAHAWREWHGSFVHRGWLHSGCWWGSLFTKPSKVRWKYHFCFCSGCKYFQQLYDSIDPSTTSATIWHYYSIDPSTTESLLSPSPFLKISHAPQSVTQFTWGQAYASWVVKGRHAVEHGPEWFLLSRLWGRVGLVMRLQHLL